MEQEQPPRQIVRLSDFKIAKQSGRESTPKSALFMMLAQKMLGEDIGLPAFGRNFHLVEPSPGRYLVMREKSRRIVVTTSMDDVSKSILRYAHKKLGHDDEWTSWVEKTAVDAAKFWAAMAAENAIEMPKPWVWRDDDSLCFHRLPWNKGETGPTPTWDRLMTNMGNARAFKAWVGSLFVPESDRQTYIWLYGAGMNGKGSVIRFLSRVFGAAFGSEDANQASGRFWTAGLLGKRLVAFSDTNNTKFPASGLFKALTGNDPIRVEIKGGDTFSANLQCKIMFASNERPVLSKSKADMRRAIFCEMKPIERAEAGFESALWEEGGAFITSAIEEYMSHYSDHLAIRPDSDALMELVDDLEAPIRALYYEHFTTEPPKDQGGLDWEMRPVELARWLARFVRDPKDQRKFRDFLTDMGHVKYSVRLGSERCGKRYKGVRLVDFVTFRSVRDDGDDAG